jgi:hypothetical protein
MRVTYFEAALVVLARSGGTLTTREIVGAALDSGLIKPSGKTPEATMSAELYRRAKSDERLVKLAMPGASRAERGSVRWSLRRP